LNEGEVDREFEGEVVDGEIEGDVEIADTGVVLGFAVVVEKPVGQLQKGLTKGWHCLKGCVLQKAPGSQHLVVEEH
jgi:hypothetical protein